MVEHFGDNLWAKSRLARVHPANGLQQIAGPRSLEHVACWRRRQLREDALIVIVCCEDQDTTVGVPPFDLAGSLKASQPGHGKVHKDHVRDVLNGQSHSFYPIGGLRNYLEISVFEKSAGHLAHKSVVLGQEHPDMCFFWVHPSTDIGTPLSEVS